MATVEFIKEKKQTRSAMKGVIDYCSRYDKTFDKISGQTLVSGINCDGRFAFQEFIFTKKAYDKLDGVNFYQYVQSFSPNEDITPEKAHKIAREFAEKAWSGYEVLVTTHCDASHIHSHFVINSVGLNDGKKLRQSPNTLVSLREISDSICKANGLNILEPYKKDGSKISTREYRAAQKGDSWKFQLMGVINKAMQKSGNKKEFIDELKRYGYEVTWTDERKYITFKCPNGMKCRDIKLHQDKYLKEVLESEFKLRQQWLDGIFSSEESIRYIRNGVRDEEVSATGVRNTSRYEEERTGDNETKQSDSRTNASFITDGTNKSEAIGMDERVDRYSQRRFERESTEQQGENIRVTKFNPELWQREREEYFKLFEEPGYEFMQDARPVYRSFEQAPETKQADDTGYIISNTLGLVGSLASIIDNENSYQSKAVTDKKAKSKTAQKKLAQGIKPTDEDEGFNLSM